ncbi:MAG: PAS domain-containing protein [Deltaproteobacteria bacterium]|nr:PAS domain-containing protein [Deltaproteobacteria bacterium]
MNSELKPLITEERPVSPLWRIGSRAIPVGFAFLFLFFASAGSLISFAFGLAAVGMGVFLGARMVSEQYASHCSHLMDSLRGTLSEVIRRTGFRDAPKAMEPESTPTEDERTLLQRGRITGTFRLAESLDWNIRELVRLYELLTTNIAASVIIFEVGRKVTFCSAYTQVLTGYSQSELFDTDRDILHDIVVDEDRARYERAWSVSALGDDSLVKYQIHHRSGIPLWLETRFVPILDEQAEVTAVMSLTIDLTELLAQKRQVEEKNQDLQDFTYMVSHDLKAPIFTIKGIASALDEDYGTVIGSEGKELIHYIVEGAGRLERLVSSVLLYSRLTTSQSKDTVVPLDDVLQQVLQDFSQQMKETQAQVTVSALPKVWGDPLRLYQVFSNLVGNAIKYRDPSRLPVITVHPRAVYGGFAVIDVTDNGSGIPEDRISEIFRPYQRAHGNEIEGSGIGLACVKKIVDACGGSVNVRSQQGEGSTFSVSLPLPLPKPQSVPEGLERAFE